MEAIALCKNALSEERAVYIEDVAPLSERQFQAQIVKAAKALRWRIYHTYRSTRSPAGFPDLVLVRPPRLIFAEVKAAKGKVTVAQQEWLDDLDDCRGVEAYDWWPRDWDRIVEILS